MPDAVPPQLTGALTLREAAEYMHRDPRTITRWRERGLIRSYLVGGRRYYTRADLNAFVLRDSLDDGRTTP